MIEYLAPKNTYKKEETEHPNNSPRELLPPKRNPNSEIESKVANFLLERILSLHKNEKIITYPLFTGFGQPPSNQVRFEFHSPLKGLPGKQPLLLIPINLKRLKPAIQLP